MQESASGAADSDLGSDLSPADEQLVRIKTSRMAHANSQALVVTVAGEIDMFTVDRLRAALGAGLDQLRDGEILVIDLTKVTYMSSTGLQALVDVADAMQPRREPLRIVVDHTQPVILPLKITGLDEYLALFTTVEDSLRAPC